MRPASQRRGKAERSTGVQRREATAKVKVACKLQPLLVDAKDSSRPLPEGGGCKVESEAGDPG